MIILFVIAVIWFIGGYFAGRTVQLEFADSHEIMSDYQPMWTLGIYVLTFFYFVLGFLGLAVALFLFSGDRNDIFRLTEN